MDIPYHYPPELLQLLIDTIPRLCRSREDVLLFFRGAGVPERELAPLRTRVRAKEQGLHKFAIARTVLSWLNDLGEGALRERREVLRRVVELDDFSTCWPEDQLKAKGLVAEIQRVINVKDSFTRIRQEREREAATRRATLAARERTEAVQRQERQAAKDAVFAAFAISDPAARGRNLESALNRLFKAHDILVREAFHVVSDETGRILEQIDGVIELESHLYFVEVKWQSKPLDVEQMSRHLVRIYHRGQSRGLVITATELTEGALKVCTEALQRTVVAIALLDEIIEALETDSSLVDLFRAKVHAAQSDKQPFRRIRLRSA